MDSDTKITVILSKENFIKWKMQIKIVLMAKGFTDYLTATPDSPSSDQKKEMGEVMWLMIQSLSDVDMKLVEGYDSTPKAMYDRLMSKYEPIHRSRMRDLFRKLLSSNDGSPTEILQNVRRLKTYIESPEVKDKWEEMFIIITLSKLDEEIAVKIIYSKEHPINTFEDLERRALHYTRIANKSDQPKVKVENSLSLNVKTQIKCSHCGRDGHLEHQCYGKHPQLKPSYSQRRKSRMNKNKN